MRKYLKIGTGENGYPSRVLPHEKSNLGLLFWMNFSGNRKTSEGYIVGVEYMSLDLRLAARDRGTHLETISGRVAGKLHEWRKYI